MYHFFVPEGQSSEGIFRITGEDVHHIRSVLRMHPGEEVVISDGSDRDYYCSLTQLTADWVEAKVMAESESAELPGELVLYQGLPKADKMEWIIQKAVELGAVKIVPVAMKRSVVKLDEKKKKSRLERWNAIAQSAAKQSGRGICPCVEEVLTFAEAVAEAREMDQFFLPYENARGIQDTKKALEDLQCDQKVAIFIGPEGGFAPEEIELAQQSGARLLSLGKRILRTETAGMAMLTLCMIRLEEQGEREHGNIFG